MGILEKIKKIGQDIWEVICEIWDEVIEFFSKVFNRLADLFSRVLIGVWHATETLIKVAANGMAKIITKVYTPTKNSNKPRMTVYQATVPVSELPPKVREKYNEAIKKGEANITAEQEQLLELELGNI